MAQFNASLALGYIPPLWKNATVVFLPKPSKTDVMDARSYRPIMLSSFILKLLERLVLYRLEETALTRTPLHPSQHGFVRAKNTETATSTLVDREDARDYIRWVTGHNFLQYHKSLLDEGKTNPMCRLCGQEPESSSHLLVNCPTLEEQRTRYLGGTDITDPTKIKVPKLLRFIKVLSKAMETPEDKDSDDEMDPQSAE
jgi:hypothetical protein